jgi:hypothetical protein
MSEILRSTAPKKRAKKSTTINTTIVAPTNSFQVGHSTRESSTLTSFKNCIAFFISIPMVAGQEGFEPPTRRFGVCRSTVRATGLYPLTLFLYAYCAYDNENNIYLIAMTQ